MHKTLNNAKLLLIPEIVFSPFLPELEEYFTMLKALSKESSQIYYFDPLQDQNNGDIHLADRNHLTKEGNQWLGEQIAEHISNQGELFSY